MTELSFRTTTALVAGGGGFLGSHLCAALLADGKRVICIDSFLTGSRQNLRRLAGPGLTVIDQDICEPIDICDKIDEIYNLACAASPPRYQSDPVHTMMTNVLGTKNLLDLAERRRARFVQASTSEIYGDPKVHPQPEDYRGDVNCIGIRACYDEGKRAAEALCFDFLRSGRVDGGGGGHVNTQRPPQPPAGGRRQ
jgi:UDP-glucuronate decarboxylase